RCRWCRGPTCESPQSLRRCHHTPTQPVRAGRKFSKAVERSKTGRCVDDISVFSLNFDPRLSEIHFKQRLLRKMAPSGAILDVRKGTERSVATTNRLADDAAARTRFGHRDGPAAAIAAPPRFVAPMIRTHRHATGADPNRLRGNIRGRTGFSRKRGRRDQKNGRDGGHREHSHQEISLALHPATMNENRPGSTHCRTRCVCRTGCESSIAALEWFLSAGTSISRVRAGSLWLRAHRLPTRS